LQENKEEEKMSANKLGLILLVVGLIVSGIGVFFANELFSGVLCHGLPLTGGWCLGVGTGCLGMGIAFRNRFHKTLYVWGDC